MTDEQIKKLSTRRLLNIFRIFRGSIFGRDTDRPWTEGDYEEDELFDRLKAELDKREHLERR